MFKSLRWGTRVALIALASLISISNAVRGVRQAEAGGETVQFRRLVDGKVVDRGVLPVVGEPRRFTITSESGDKLTLALEPYPLGEGQKPALTPAPGTLLANGVFEEAGVVVTAVKLDPREEWEFSLGEVTIRDPGFSLGGRVEVRLTATPREGGKARTMQLEISEGYCALAEGYARFLVMPPGCQWEEIPRKARQFDWAELYRLEEEGKPKARVLVEKGKLNLYRWAVSLSRRKDKVSE